MCTSSRCTQASLRAFKIEAYPKFGSGCLQYFVHAGYDLTDLPHLRGSTMSKLRVLDDGDYFIITKGHAMSLRNGILIDTERKGFDSKRTIECIWRVEEQHAENH
jgi:hypothetical protein